MAGFMLGNLSVEDAERRTGIAWPEKLKQYMADKHQPSASNIQPGKWHCFDAPFMLVCGDMETAQAIYDHLAPMHADFKVPMEIGITQLSAKNKEIGMETTTVLTDRQVRQIMKEVLVVWTDGTEEFARAVEQAVLQSPEINAQPKLKVEVRTFPESNGKRNWTALLLRSERWDGLPGNCGGITVDQGEFWNRVAYEAERTKYLLGLRDTEPFILDYGDDIETPDQWKGETATRSQS